MKTPILLKFLIGITALISSNAFSMEGLLAGLTSQMISEAVQQTEAVEQQELKRVAANPEKERRKKIETILINTDDISPRLKEYALARVMAPQSIDKDVIRKYHDNDYRCQQNQNSWCKYPYTHQRTIAKASGTVIHSAAISPNGRYVAMECTRPGAGPGGCVSVVDSETGNEVRNNNIAYHPALTLAVKNPLAWSANSKVVTLYRRGPHDELVIHGNVDEIQVENDEGPLNLRNFGRQQDHIIGSSAYNSGDVERDNPDVFNKLRDKFNCARITISPAKNIVATYPYYPSNKRYIFDNDDHENCVQLWDIASQDYAVPLVKLTLPEEKSRIQNVQFSQTGLFVYVTTTKEVIQYKPVVGSIARSIARRSYPLKIAAILSCYGMVRKIVAMQSVANSVYSKSKLLNGVALIALGVMSYYGNDLLDSEYDLFKKWWREKV